MQMIAHYTVKSYAAFRTAFDADAEDRGNNSLNLLHFGVKATAAPGHCSMSATPGRRASIWTARRRSSTVRAA